MPSGAQVPSTVRSWKSPLKPESVVALAVAVVGANPGPESLGAYRILLAATLRSILLSERALSKIWLGRLGGTTATLGEVSGRAETKL